ncbi:MAG: HNH endonuclease, partial [Alphaproteobacteria bacterium]|nr:HNH endonuclease [Alphaproteobacteria bacterium]
AYEVDHLIPLELGGANDIANLFPEAAKPTPGFHEKDLVENYLHQKVCDGEVALAYAQQQIATNWLVVWRSLTSAEIAALKAQY